MEDPKISLIIPVYNAEEYLPRCIDSILNQSYKNLEIILVDDGSKDGSGKMCDDFALKDPRIVVVHQLNGGASSARNHGLDIASGELIAFVDSDDFIHPDMYRVLHQALVQDNADIAQCSFINVEDSEMILPETIQQSEIIDKLEAARRISYEYPLFYIVVWNKIYRRSIFRDIRFPLSKMYEDEFLSLKLFFETNRISVVNTPLYYYYQSPVSVMRGSFSKQKLQYIEAIEERLLFLRMHNLKDFERINQKKLCYWILSFYHRNHADVKGDKEISSYLIGKYNEHTRELLKQHPTGWLHTIAFRISPFFPDWAGFLFFHKLYRNNIVTKVATIIYGD